MNLNLGVHYEPLNSHWPLKCDYVVEFLLLSCKRFRWNEKDVLGYEDPDPGSDTQMLGRFVRHVLQAPDPQPDRARSDGAAAPGYGTG